MNCIPRPRGPSVAGSTAKGKPPTAKVEMDSPLKGTTHRGFFHQLMSRLRSYVLYSSSAGVEIMLGLVLLPASV